MKKSISVLIVLLLFTVIVACSANDDATTNPKESTSEQTDKADKDITYPDKPIEMIVGFGAGGATDLVARIVATNMEKYIGQSVNIINLEGGAGVKGMTELFNAKPDGYTIATTPNSTITIQPHRDAIYEHDDFIPVIQVTDTDFSLVVAKDAPYNTFEEWVDWVKENPGKFEYGTPGAGGITHLTLESVANELNLDIKNIPYDSGTEAITQMIGGHIDGGLLQVTEVEPHFKSGDAKVLFISGDEKNDHFPDVPSLADLGLETRSSAKNIVTVPKDTPNEIVKILHDSIKQALEDEELIEQLENIGTEVHYSNTEDLKKLILEEYELYGDVLQKIGW